MEANNLLVNQYDCVFLDTVLRKVKKKKKKSCVYSRSFAKATFRL